MQNKKLWIRIGILLFLLSLAVAHPASRQALESFKSLFSSAPTTSRSLPPALTSNTDIKIDRQKLEDLKKKGDAGDYSALRELCSYVVARDLYDLSGFEVSNDLQEFCGEMRPEKALEPGE